MVADVGNVFHQMSASDWRQTRGAGAWTRLEILGHLIDSAANNHQRFVRAMDQGELTWPGYDQNAMVRVQQFGRATPALLISLWESFNFYLAHLVSLLQEGQRRVTCIIGDSAPVTLEFLIFDYVAHMQHHLRQIFEGMTVKIRWVEV